MHFMVPNGTGGRAMNPVEAQVVEAATSSAGYGVVSRQDELCPKPAALDARISAGEPGGAMKPGRFWLRMLVALLPVALAACTEATSSTDARTQLPLVQVQAVKVATPSERSFTGVVAARV